MFTQIKNQIESLAVNQERLDADSDADYGYTAQVHHNWDANGPPLCQKHKKPLEYIHHLCTMDSIPKHKKTEIHLKEGQYIVRGDPCIYYNDEFSDACVWGNEFRLYNNNVKNLCKLIKNKKTSNHFYICHMSKTFATPGKRMYFSVPFSKNSLFPHMNANHDELPISNGDGTANVIAHFIKGLDNRATITTNWSAFFRKL